MNKVSTYFRESYKELTEKVTWRNIELGVNMYIEIKVRMGHVLYQPFDLLRVLVGHDDVCYSHRMNFCR